MRHRRILVKLSGEAMAGSDGFGLNLKAIEKYATDISGAVRAGAQLAVVVGGGNFFRGYTGASSNLPRAGADYIGMLATMMNTLALREVLTSLGVDAEAMSSVPMPSVCQTFNRVQALAAIRQGTVVICGGGTGNPFVTTDTAAVLRAAELECNAVYKGTQVDGVYSADPREDESAKRFDRIDFDHVIREDLKVMDLAAIALAREAAMPIVVFDIHKPDALTTILSGRGICTEVVPRADA
ncbi:MAG: UMP kinase [Pseudomonadota bacterium]